MTDWSSLVVPGVRGLEALDVEATVADVRALHSHERPAKLDWNENLFGALPGVLEEAALALANASRYPIALYDDFRAEVARAMGTDAAHVFPAHGLQALIGTFASAFLRPGDRVVVPAVTFYLYRLVCAARGAVVHTAPMRGYALDLQALLAKADEVDAKLIWICDPNNPTATVLEASEWNDFVAALPDGCVAVVDEAYTDFLPPETRPRREAHVEGGRRVVLLRSFSKLYGLAGLRLGYAVAAEPVARALAVLDEPFNVNAPALAAGIASLRATDAAAARRREVAAARELLVQGLRDAGAQPLPSDVGFVLARVDVDDVALTRELGGAGVLVRSGAELGLPGHVRIAVPPPVVVDRVLQALEPALRALRG
jgi:histidinol-phosphate aminotransferase